MATFSISNAGTVTEGGYAIFTVTMTGSINAPVTVYYSTIPETAWPNSGDYPFNIVDQPLTFNPGGLAQQQIAIPIYVESPNPEEPAQTFSVSLLNAPGGSVLGTGTATIATNGSNVVTPPSFSISNTGLVTEGGNAIFTITMTGSISTPVQVYYRMFPGTASAYSGDYPHTNPFWYQRVPLTFNPGESAQQQISIPINVESPNLPEIAETFSVLLYLLEAIPPTYRQERVLDTTTVTIAANGESSARISIEGKEIIFGGPLLPIHTGDGHLYLVYTDESGKEFVLRAGSAANASPFGSMLVEPGVPIAASADFRPFSSAASRGTRDLNLGGRNAADVWAVMVQRADNVAIAQLNYDPLTQNSNSFVASVLNSVGLDMVFPFASEGVTHGYTATGNLLGLNETFFGTSSNDIIRGGDGNDILNGGIGNDRLSGGTGNNVINGGEHVDTAVYSGVRADYNISFSVGAVAVVGSNNSDTLTNIEFLEFADQTINVNGGVAPPSFSISNAGTVTEGGNAIFTVIMTGSISAPVTIYYSTIPGTASANNGDYPLNTVNLPLTFNPGGSAQQQISIPINVESPNLREIAQTFSVSLLNAPGGSVLDTGAATIAANGEGIPPDLTGVRVLIQAGHEGGVRNLTNTTTTPSAGASNSANGWTERNWTPVVADAATAWLRGRGATVFREDGLLDSDPVAPGYQPYSVDYAVFIHFDGSTNLSTTAASIGYSLDNRGGTDDVRFAENWKETYTQHNWPGGWHDPYNYTPALQGYYGYSYAQNTVGEIVIELGTMTSDHTAVWAYDRLPQIGHWIGEAIYTTVTGSLPCFLASTRIATARGEIPVENLMLGDLVHAQFSGLTPVKWIGHRHVDCRRHPDPRKVWPIRVAAGAFGESFPHHDLWLSPDHAVFVDDVLIPIKHLINGITIEQVPTDEVSYYHVELPCHDVLLAEGLPVESYLDTGDRSNFENGNRLIALHPDFSARMWEAMGCAPLVVYGHELNTVRQRLNGWARIVCQKAQKRTRGRRKSAAVVETVSTRRYRRA